MNILITGGAGFIGSNFIPYFLDRYENYYIVNLDKLTYAGDLDNLKEVTNHPRYFFEEGDICNREKVEWIFKHYNIKGVIHFAAESHVDNSIKQPDVFVKTNVNGTFTLLDVAYRYWMKAPFQYQDRYNTTDIKPRFHHISTDEVYGSLGQSGKFTEQTPYAPNSPYSASKASSDMLVRSYHHTYGLDTIITNCSNNYGAKQHDEKFIPTIIKKALAHEPIPIYGDGKNVRDWLYVQDHCSGIDIAYHKGKSGESYNIGTNNEQDNLSIVDKVCTILDTIHPLNDNKSYKQFITHVQDRPGHDKRYAIDATKIKTKLGWSASTSFDKGLKETVKWYMEKYL